MNLLGRAPKRPPQFLRKPRGPLVSEAQTKGAARGGWRVYPKNTGAIAAADVSGPINLTFPRAVEVWGIGMAGIGGGTAEIGGRDAFTFLISRQTGDKLVTEETIPVAIIGPLDSIWWLADPWEFAAGDSMVFDVTNLDAQNEVTAYFTVHCEEYGVKTAG